jgi:hypothetical protein
MEVKNVSRDEANVMSFQGIARDKWGFRHGGGRMGMASSGILRILAEYILSPGSHTRPGHKHGCVADPTLAVAGGCFIHRLQGFAFDVEIARPVAS